MGGFTRIFSRPKPPPPPPPPPPPAPAPEPQQDKATKEAAERKKRGRVRGMEYGTGSTLGGGDEATTARTILGQ